MLREMCQGKKKRLNMKEKGSRYTKRKARMESKIMEFMEGTEWTMKEKLMFIGKYFPGILTLVCAESCFNQTLFALLLINLA